jgi:cyclophilin family peptidyl-prolyl cis-trans isomerase/HEAT repeat protein
VIIACAIGAIAQTRQSSISNPIPQETMLRILQAEDERRWDNNLATLLNDPNPALRRRAALAAGRIGDEAAVTELERLLAANVDADVREMAAFALGEIESESGADALLLVLRNQIETGPLRARAVEAVGKISASLPAAKDKRKLELNAAILETLKSEVRRRSASNTPTILLGLTAALRARVADAGPTIVEFLDYSVPRIRADAANALARLRSKEGVQKLRELVATDPDGIVRANAARALGAAEDNEAFAALLDRALNDNDLRVRISAIRSLGALKDQRLTPLLRRAAILSKSDLRNRPSEANEILDIATTLGRVFQGTENQETLAWLKEVRPGFDYAAPELEIAFARISPAAYLEALGSNLPSERRDQKLLPVQWKAAASLAQGLAEVAAAAPSLKDRDKIVAQAETILRSMLNYRISGLNTRTMIAVHSEYAVPDMLRSLAAFKPKDLSEVLRNQLRANDVIIRATAADLLGELPAEEGNAQMLAAALPAAMKDELNDAALSILDSLAKQKTVAANDAIKNALASSDYLLRRRAVALLKENGAGDFPQRIGTVTTRNTLVDYRRALARAGQSTRATVTTTKGSFVIEFISDQAPLTVDNFVRLAQKGYFNGQTIPRVVPNFVIQAGDPRGDQNGGPGYQIRCEINEVPYERAAVGMALSGKDTGGSQWFVTHSPQPHLDGGYTVFGHVISGMEVVDTVVRGDIIRSVTIIERSSARSRK